jgi:hypothetical protein
MSREYELKGLSHDEKARLAAGTDVDRVLDGDDIGDADEGQASRSA